ncbi:MAG: DUF928 domain-containing protein [Cyanobacteriota bacterium]|nr:DUF928 domain-containing protein [Cyanobacteriota bacterium]
MARLTSLLKVTVFSLALSLELTIAARLGLPAKAGGLNFNRGVTIGVFNPPDRGAPTTAVGGATRGSDLCAEVKPLIPKDTSHHRENPPYFGLALMERPTLFFHVKGSAKYTGETLYFALNRVDADGNLGELVYETNLSLPDRGGVMSVSLPPQATLDVGQSYQWYLEMTCNADSPNAEGNSLEGWIDRVDRTPDLADRLEIARTPTDRATVYAEAGIWFDAIDTLARERLDEDTPELKAAWDELLGDSDVGLGDVVEASLLD